MITKKFLALARLPMMWGQGIYAEQAIINYLKGRLPKLKQDEYGNLYYINPGTPLVCAHMDTVETEACSKKRHTVKMTAGVIKGDNIILGGDDKCGVALAMQLYEDFGDRISLLFTRQEERGCCGARAFCKDHSDLLATTPYCIVPDRRGSGDLICFNNSFGSKDFEDKVLETMSKYGYKATTGSISDTGVLKTYMNGFNFSVGYYEPHSIREYVIASELVNAYEAIVELIIADLPRMPTFLETRPSYAATPTASWSVSTYKQQKEKRRHSSQKALPFEIDEGANAHKSMSEAAFARAVTASAKEIHEGYPASLKAFISEDKLTLNQDMLLFDSKNKRYICKIKAGSYDININNGEIGGVLTVI